MSTVATRLVCATRALGPCPTPFGSRFFSTVKFLDQKRSGEETVYFKKEDEALLRALLSKHPEVDPKFVSTGTEGSLRTLQGTLALCISKHLNVQPSKALLDDIIQVFVNSGWKLTESKSAPEKA